MNKKTKQTLITYISSMLIILILAFIGVQQQTAAGSRQLEFSILKTDKIEIEQGGILDTRLIYQFVKEVDDETMCLIEYYDNDEWIAGDFIAQRSLGVITTNAKSFILTDKPQGQHSLTATIQCAIPTTRQGGQFRIFSTTPEGDRKGFTSHAYKALYDALPDEAKQYFGTTDVPIEIGPLTIPIRDYDTTIFCIDYCQQEEQIIEKVITLTKDITQDECNQQCFEIGEGTCTQSLAGQWYCVDKQIITEVVENIVYETQTEYVEVPIYVDYTCEQNPCSDDYECVDVTTGGRTYATCQLEKTFVDSNNKIVVVLAGLILVLLIIMVVIWRRK